MSVTRHFLRNSQTGGGTGGDVYDLSETQGSPTTIVSPSNSSTSFLEVLRWQVTLGSALPEASIPTSIDISAVTSGQLLYRWRVQRLDSSNNVLDSSGYSSEENTTGTKAETLSLSTAWAAGDRLALSLELRRNGGANTARTVTVSVNNTASFIDPDLVVAAQAGAASLTGAGSISADATAEIFPAFDGAVFDEDVFATEEGVAVFDGAATLSGTGTIASAAVRVAGGVTELSGVGTIAAAATVVQAAQEGEASLSGVGTISADGQRDVDGQAAMVGTGVLTANGGRVTTGLIGLVGSGTITSEGLRTSPAESDLSASGQITTTANVIRQGSASLSGEGTITSDGLISGLPIEGTATLSAIGSVEISAVKTTPGSTSLVGTGQISANGELAVLVFDGASSLTGTGTLLAGATRVAEASVNLSAVSTISPTPTYTATSYSVALLGEGVISANATKIVINVNKIKVGVRDVDAIYFGQSSVSGVYFGTNKIWG